MTAQVPSPCSVAGCESWLGKKYATRFIFLGNRGYGVCEECFKLFGKIRQLILYTEDEKLGKVVHKKAKVVHKFAEPKTE